MSQAVLPKQMETQTLAALRLGQSTWTLPWAISVDTDGHMWLNLKYPQRDEQGGTSLLLVTREEDGSWSAVLHGEYTWQRMPGSTGAPLARFEIRG